MLCGILVIAAAVDERSRLSGGSLRASLAAVIDQCRGKGGKRRTRGREQGRDDEGRGPRRPCHSNLIHTAYLEKLYSTPRMVGLGFFVCSQLSGGTERSKGEEVNCLIKFQLN